MPPTAALQPLDLVYTAGPVTKRFHEDVVSRVKLLIGPFGTGKTTAAGWDLIMLASQRVKKSKDGVRRSRFAVIRNTWPQLRDTTIKTYTNWFPELYFGKYTVTDHKYLIRQKGWEVELIFKALDEPESVRDLLSLELTGAHFDEVREIDETIFTHLMGRTKRYPSKKETGDENSFLTTPQVVLTTNYPSTQHWLYKKFVETPLDGYTIYEQTQAENSHNLHPDYYTDLERDFADRPDMLRTLVRGQWGVTVMGRQVYTEFRRETHVSKKPLKPMRTTVIRGWDNTGLSPACVITQLSPTGQWLILKEFCGEDVGILDFTEMVVSWCNQAFHQGVFYKDYCDPAGKARQSNLKSPADYMKQLGIMVADGIQDFKIRREMVAKRLTYNPNGEPAILVDPSCTTLIDGFEGGYAYPQIGSSGVYKPEPAKNRYSHIHDALQYPATKLFWTPPVDQTRLKLPSIGIV